MATHRNAVIACPLLTMIEGRASAAGLVQRDARGQRAQ
ncbi:MAG: hypothetical protein AVDCRST_MAG77-1725 [uncultured Chloroflexi bacterium]|uniref:Uncharacterized protein n=1 Tax=uncultured Chloroflexota bacterium TaxID=166587 RepID=A0A6J4IAH3_9CHLR|nr:MAG: hypothetical protein AVDCRST_MAG77-1725 [uncultured Chloroflexota bacterium]